MEFEIEIQIMPRQGILDPQGEAVAGALSSLGFRGVREIHVGRAIRLRLEADSEDAARERVTEMCRALLANPVTEDFFIEVREYESA